MWPCQVKNRVGVLEGNTSVMWKAACMTHDRHDVQHLVPYMLQCFHGTPAVFVDCNHVGTAAAPELLFDLCNRRQCSSTRNQAALVEERLGEFAREERGRVHPHPFQLGPVPSSQLVQLKVASATELQEVLPRASSLPLLQLRASPPFRRGGEEGLAFGRR